MWWWSKFLSNSVRKLWWQPTLHLRLKRFVFCPTRDFITALSWQTVPSACQSHLKTMPFFGLVEILSPGCCSTKVWVEYCCLTCLNDYFRASPIHLVKSSQKFPRIFFFFFAKLHTLSLEDWVFKTCFFGMNAFPLSLSLSWPEATFSRENGGGGKRIEFCPNEKSVEMWNLFA